MGKIATKCKEKILEKWQYPLKLLVGDKKKDNRKEYKNQKSEDEIKELNKRLKEQNNK